MIIKIKPNIERAKSMLLLIKQREEFIKTLDEKKFPTIALETYYEIVKELSSSFLIINGIKATGENAHRDMIDEISKNKILSEAEISLFHDLRIKRNSSYYDGKIVNSDYISEKKSKIEEIINKLKKEIDKKLR